jgi:hypothetical protein
MLEAVFSIVRAAVTATQWRHKHVFTATVELQEKSCDFYVVRVKRL